MEETMSSFLLQEVEFSIIHRSGGFGWTDTKVHRKGLSRVGRVWVV